MRRRKLWESLSGWTCTGIAAVGYLWEGLRHRITSFTKSERQHLCKAQALVFFN